MSLFKYCVNKTATYPDKENILDYTEPNFQNNVLTACKLSLGLNYERYIFLSNNNIVSIVVSIQIKTASDETVKKNKCAIREDPTYFVKYNHWQQLIDTTINPCGKRKVSSENTIFIISF